MARKCDICGKGTVAGNNVPRKGLPKKKGGAGQHIGVKTKRTFKPNLVKVKIIDNGTVKSVKMCTRCLRTGNFVKAV
ncbi:MAG: 50S ribosomal protein L28 [Spirochaetales bacterium]|nr:50S ribosomal protein L28 [Spirochaetales bacterium]